jgi:SAM-dependent methyltransferase
MKSIEQKIQSLGPWIYDYKNKDGYEIKSGFDSHFYRDKNEMMKKFFIPEVSEITNVLFKNKDLSNYRAIDLGCLEGHFSSILCQKNFQEVVSVDLSETFVEKARFLLKEFYGYKNSTVVNSNILDKEKLSKLGKFNLIIAKGIFYHLKNPSLIFDIFDLLKPDNDDPFYILIDTQYKTNNVNFVLSDTGISEYKASTSSEMDEFDYNYNLDKKDDTYKIKIGSTFDSIRQISNPKSFYFLIKKYYYKQIISYNVANYSAINLLSKLIISKNTDNDLLINLNKSSINKFTEFKNWDGKSVAGIDFENLWYFKIINSNLLKRLSYYLKSFYLTSLEVSIAKNAPKEIIDLKLKALKEGAERNNSKFEKFKCFYFSRKLKKIHGKVN